MYNRKINYPYRKFVYYLYCWFLPLHVFKLIIHSNARIKKKFCFKKIRKKIVSNTGIIINIKISKKSIKIFVDKNFIIREVMFVKPCLSINSVYAIPMMLFSFMCHGNILSIVAELKPTPACNNKKYPSQARMRRMICGMFSYKL